VGPVGKKEKVNGKQRVSHHTHTHYCHMQRNHHNNKRETETDSDEEERERERERERVELAIPMIRKWSRKKSGEKNSLREREI
jgi:hypothetical protein